MTCQPLLSSICITELRSCRWLQLWQILERKHRNRLWQSLEFGCQIEVLVSQTDCREILNNLCHISEVEQKVTKTVPITKNFKSAIMKGLVKLNQLIIIPICEITFRSNLTNRLGWEQYRWTLATHIDYQYHSVMFEVWQWNGFPLVTQNFKIKQTDSIGR